MEVLFLDDEQWRWDTFHKAFPDAHWARTAHQANSLIDLVEFDLICLDHDLGLANQSGMTVVDHLVRRARPIPRVWIHSWNGPAASSMHLALYRSGLVGDLFRETFCPDAVQQVLRRVS